MADNESVAHHFQHVATGGAQIPGCGIGVNKRLWFGDGAVLSGQLKVVHSRQHSWLAESKRKSGSQALYSGTALRWTVQILCENHCYALVLSGSNGVHGCLANLHRL